MDAPAFSLPEGYSVVNYSDEREKREYYYIHYLIEDSREKMESFFDTTLLHYPDCVPERDTFFLKCGEEYVGTVTAIVHPVTNSGYVHMVCIREDYRGKGLAGLLNGIALQKLLKRDIEYILLTTDDWRLPAIKSYLKAGFLPVISERYFFYKRAMLRRWKKIYRKFGLTELTYFTMDMGIKRVEIKDKND